MSGFADKFGGSSLQPSYVAYRAAALVANAATFWPPYADTTNVLSRLLDVTASAPGFILSLPDATLGSLGADVIITNRGVNNFLVANFAGTTLYTVTPGQCVYFYLTDTSTSAGAWTSFLLGVGLSSLDLTSAAGNGLVVASGKLAVSPISSAVAGNRTIALTDRATSFVWQGGTGTFTLPLSSSVGQFFFEVRNSGTGALTVNTTGGELIDSSASIILQVNESCLIHAGVGFWYTVGRGRSVQFSFTQLQKVVTGGTVTETLTEAANVVQTFTGALTSNVDIVVPAVVQVYYVSNQTSGAFNFRVKNPGAGTTVSIPTGQNAVLFSDGTNVINASTTVAGISALLLASGTAATPSLGVGASNSGIFSPGSNQVSVSTNGTEVARFTTSGLLIPVNGGQVSVVSTAGNALLSTTRPAGSYGVVQFYTAATLRWVTGANSDAESGSNAGSNWTLDRYADAGTVIDSPLKVNRATGITTLQTTAQTSTLNVTDTGASGVSILMTGNGGTTPTKRVKVLGGSFLVANDANSTILTLTDAGALTAAGNITAFSDRRLKENIHTAHGALNRLAQVRGVTFNRVDLPGKPAGRGVIAQELRDLYPELVHTHESGMLSVDYLGLIGELVEAVKELSAEVKELRK